MGHPWWERYQPISYILTTRSGNESEFLDMSRRCNAVGVRIYADVVFNHMSADYNNTVGSAGSKADPQSHRYPAVPYGPTHFYKPCLIKDYLNPYQVRNCELLGIHNLNLSNRWVRFKIIELLNHLIQLGVAGFRIDCAKHMWPTDLTAIYGGLDNLSTNFGFVGGSKPFIYQEVIDMGNEPITKYEYNGLGVVTEFRYSAEIGHCFSGNNSLKWLINWGKEWSFLPSKDALVFVDNQVNQRGYGAGGTTVLTYKDSRQYKMAVGFMLAHPYGIPRIMSSFHFEDINQGPPQDDKGNIISPNFDDISCGNGWVCEHRWKQIFNMIQFRNAVRSTPLNNWWDNGNKQIAFCRGQSGFIAFNGESDNLAVRLQTCLPEGPYCDVISGEKDNSGGCTGISVNVDADGMANVSIAGDADDGHIAIHK